MKKYYPSTEEISQLFPILESEYLSLEDRRKIMDDIFYNPNFNSKEEFEEIMLEIKSSLRDRIIDKLNK